MCARGYCDECPDYPCDEVVDKAVDVVTNGITQRPDFDINSLSDYSQMKEKLAMEVVSAEANKEILETVPHQNIEDMAVVYRFVLNSDDEGRASILVTMPCCPNGFNSSARKAHIATSLRLIPVISNTLKKAPLFFFVSLYCLSSLIAVWRRAFMVLSVMFHSPSSSFVERHWFIAACQL